MIDPIKPPMIKVELLIDTDIFLLDVRVRGSGNDFEEENLLRQFYSGRHITAVATRSIQQDFFGYVFPGVAIDLRLVDHFSEEIIEPPVVRLTRFEREDVV